MRDLIRNVLEGETMTTQQASELLQVHPSAVRQMVLDGRLPSVKKGFVRLLDAQDVHAMLGS